MRIIDSHCHLNFPDFQADLPACIARAEMAGVVGMQTICTQLSEMEEVYAIAEQYPQVVASVGVHPCNVKETEQVQLAQLQDYAARPKVVGLGETGLDYYHDASLKQAQKISFNTHIRCAQETGLPLIIHTRDAEEDTLAMLREALQQGPVQGVLHCFTGSEAFAKQALDLGFYISISGIATFKNAAALQAIVQQIPLDRLLVETDAPYLAPVPMRGKRNEPAFTAHTVAYIAALRQMPVAELAARTTENFFRLFSKASQYLS